MTPLGSQPAVVEVKPPDHSSNVEGASHWVENVWGAGHACAIGNDGALDDGSKKTCAGGKLKGFEPATEGIKEDEACRVDLISWSAMHRLLNLLLHTARSELML